MINGGVLPIRFRIEGGAVTPPGRWQNGDLVTYNQDNWGTIGTTASNLLSNHFFTVFTSGFVEFGISGSGGFSAAFTSANAVIDYQPTSGTPGALDNDLVDPTSTSSGVFGGYVLALQLDLAFTDAGLVAGSAPLLFGNLRVCNLTDTPAFNGSTVRQVIGALNTAIGGGAAPYGYDQLSTLAQQLSQSFESGAVSLFAQQHLFNGACPGGWQNGDLVTYNQDSWGGDPTSSTAAALLLAQFNTVYLLTGGVEVGIVGAAGFSMLFTSAASILGYEPANGSAAPLNSDLLDPTSSASGVFGGFVLALQLDLDFSDAGQLPNVSGLAFGDLRLCSLTATPGYNNMTIRQFRNEVNAVLGGAPAPYLIDDIAFLTDEVSRAFEGGTPSSFAQAHLVNGTCP